MSDDSLIMNVIQDFIEENLDRNKKEKLVELLADLYNITCEYCNVYEYGDIEKEENLQNKIEELQEELIKIAMKEV